MGKRYESYLYYQRTESIEKWMRTSVILNLFPINSQNFRSNLWSWGRFWCHYFCVPMIKRHTLTSYKTSSSLKRNIDSNRTKSPRESCRRIPGKPVNPRQKWSSSKFFFFPKIWRSLNLSSNTCINWSNSVFQAEDC